MTAPDERGQGGPDYEELDAIAADKADAQLSHEADLQIMEGIK